MNQKVEQILQGAKVEGRSALLEHEVYEILRAAGLDVPRYRFLAGAPGAKTGETIRAFLEEIPSEEVVLKIVSPQILHKSDVGGLAFCPRRFETIVESARQVWDEAGRRAPETDRRGLLIMERVPAAGGSMASELLLSVKQDPAFGTVLVFGLGGLLTEWYGEFSFGSSTVVLQPGLVKQSLTRLADVLPAISFLFRPSRVHAKAPLDLDRVSEQLEALGRLATAYGRGSGGSGSLRSGFTLEELEMNPMLLSRDGRLVAVDGVGRLSESKTFTPARPLHKITSLLEPKSAVVIGASSKGMNPGRIILRNLKAAEGVRYGQLFVIHPKEEAVDGIPCLRSLTELPYKVDMAVVAIPAEGARDSIRLLAEKDLADSIILIPGGFAETGQTDLEGEIIAAISGSRANPGRGPVMVGGNCLGIVSKHQYNTFFLPQYKLPFHDAPGDNLAAISQSGAYLVTLTSNLDGIIFPRASVSYGNQMDLTVSDFLEYYLTDDRVTVLACYIEGFKPLDGERFVRLARALRDQGKRVIAFKAGKTALGAKAAQSHTASLAGDYAVARFLMGEAGVIVAETLNMFEDYTKVYTMLSDRIPVNPKAPEVPSAMRAQDGPAAGMGHRIGIISNAGFECSTVLDKLYNLQLADLSDATRARLRSCLPAIAHADNPIDATPMATTKQFIEAAQAMLDDPGVDALLISPVPVTPALDNLEPDLAGTHQENMYGAQSLPQEMIRLFRETKKPVVVSVDSGRLYDAFVVMLERAGIPTYRKIDRASRALSALCTL
jgi:acyl-CoA synthetase (NDP forming)